eukprot:2470021-Rhodomonas_salina.3
MHGQASHSPVDDCKVSLQLYREYIKTGNAANAARKLQQMRFQKQFPPGKPLVIEGVCTFKYNAKECFCGQPTASFR